MPYKDPKRKKECDQRYWAKNSHRINPTRNKKVSDVRDWINAYKRSKGCLHCPESDPVCLDFHHLDPKLKSFSIGLAISKRILNKDTLMNEIDKCVVVCKNCHAKLHAYNNQITPPSLDSSRPID